MKKIILAQAVALTLMVGIDSASAEEVVVPITDLELEKENVSDIAGNEGVPNDVTNVDDIPQEKIPKEDIPKEETPVVETIDKEVDTGSASNSSSQPSVVDSKQPETQPLQSKVQSLNSSNQVMVDKELTVEPLAKTGIVDENNKLIYAISLGVLAALTLFVLRRKTVKTSE